MSTPNKVPNVTFRTHTNDRNVCGDDPFAWVDLTSEQVFKGKSVVLFALPGAFTPTCSTFQLPGYEKHHDELKALGVDEVICLSVNDAFVMNKWKEDQGVNKVTLLPDGSGEFTREMGMLVKKDNLGFGERSWRYSMYVVDGEIKKVFEEAGKMDNCPTDPFEVSDAETMIEYIKNSKE